jgi:hypothetical protein
LRRNLLKIANARIIRELGLKDIVQTAKDRIRQLDHRILGLPQDKELRIHHAITTIINEVQGSKRKKNAISINEEDKAQWLQMPPAHLVTTNQKYLTNLTVPQLQDLYKPSAFDQDAQVYIYAGKGAVRGEFDKDEKSGSVGRGMMSSNLTHERLVKIVLGLMEENVWRQKFLAGLDIKERRRQMLEENFAKRLALQTSHGRLHDEDGLSGSSQDDLSQMMRGRDASPNLPPEQSEIDDPQAKPDKQAHEASIPNWYPNQNNMVQPDASHMSLREPSEGGNRMA